MKSLFTQGLKWISAAVFPVFLWVHELPGTDITFERMLVNYHNNRTVTSITYDNENTYLAGPGGIFIYNNFRNEWDIPVSEAQGVDNTNIVSVLYHPATGYLWALTDKELYVRRGQFYWYWDLIPMKMPLERLGYVDNELIGGIGDNTYELDPYSGFIQQDAAYAEGEIFWSTENQLVSADGVLLPGNYMIDNDSELITSTGRRFPVTFTAQDQMLNIWIGTGGYGVFSGDANLMRAEHKPYGLLNDYITDIAVSDDIVAVSGTCGMNDDDPLAGVTIISGQFQKFRWVTSDEISYLVHAPVTSVVLSGDSAYYAMGSTIILHLFNEHRWEFILEGAGLTGEIYDMVKGRSSIWVAAQHGLFEIDRSTLSIRPWFQGKKLGVRSVYSVAESDSMLYIGGEFGLIQLSLDQDHYLEAQALEQNVTAGINRIVFSGDQVYYSGGASLYQAQKTNLKGTKFTVSPWFINTEILSLAANEKYLWVGTVSGLYEYHFRMRQWRKINEDQGLPDDHIRALEITEGILYIGTEKGMTTYNYEY